MGLFARVGFCLAVVGSTCGGLQAAETGVEWQLQTAYPARSSFGAVVFHDKLWIVAGADSGNYVRLKDVWVHQSGGQFFPVVREATFPQRSGHGTAVFEGRIWVTGGRDHLLNDSLQDVWSSADGLNWTQEVVSAPWGPRCDHAMVVFNGKLWIFGGVNTTANPDTRLNDIWSSTDGVTWTQESASAPWSARTDHTVTVFNNELLLIGGQDPSAANQASPELWVSTDGVNWTLRESNARFARYMHAATVHAGKIWFEGGRNSSTQRRDIWSSPDGSNWTQVASDVGLFSDKELVSYEGQLWRIGPSSSTSNQIDSSTDGVTWTPVTPTARPNSNTDHAVAEFNGRMWIAGGGPTSLVSDDVWSSADGRDWTAATTSPGWAARRGLGMAVHNGALWIYGGYNDNNSGSIVWYSDVWKSTDGATWTQEAASTALGARSGMGFLAHNGELYSFGGLRDAGIAGIVSEDDVYKSTDGINWTLVTGTAGWSARSRMGVASFNGDLYVMGSTVGTDDIWRSTNNGANWTQVTASAPWLSTTTPRPVVLGSQLYVFAGNTVYNQLYKSSDGTNYTAVVNNSTTQFVDDLGVSGGGAFMAFDGKLWTLLGFSTYSGTQGVSVSPPNPDLAGIVLRDANASGGVPGLEYTDSATVNVTFANIAATPDNIEISESNTFVSSQLVSPTATASFTFASATNGVKTLYARPIYGVSMGTVRSDTITLDSTAPTSGVSSPASQFSTTIPLTITADGTGSPVAVDLYMRTDSTSWALVGQVPAGSYSYDPSLGNTRYYFQTVARDRASNIEAGGAPTGSSTTGDCSTVFVEPGGGSVSLNVAAGQSVTIPFSASASLTIDYASVTTGGSVTVSRVAPYTGAPAGLGASFLIDEHLTIAGTFTGTASLVWNYDPVSDDSIGGGGVNRVYRFEGGTLAQTYTVAPAGTTITINGVNGFSDWYAGNVVAGVEDWRGAKW